MNGFQLPDRIFDQQAIGRGEAVLVQYGINLVLQVEHFFKGLSGFKYLAKTLGYFGAGAGNRWQWPGFFHPHDRKGQYSGKQDAGKHHNENLPGVSGADIFPKRMQAKKIDPELFPKFLVKVRAGFKMSFSVHFQGLYFPMFSSG